VGINGGWNQIETTAIGIWQTSHICLGARALGGTANLVLGTKATTCIPYDLSLDAVSFSVDTAGTCPPYGTVPNGDFEAGDKSWTLTPSSATAEIITGVGDSGSYGAHLATSQPCQQQPQITGTISIPTKQMVPNTALKVWSKGTKNTPASVLIGNAWTFFAGDGASGARNICLPQWALGTVQPITLALLQPQVLSCGPSVNDFVFDDLSFVSDPLCTTDANLFDPGFEQISLAPTAGPQWYLSPPINGGTAKLDQTPANAHSGNVAARLEVTSPCSDPGISASVTLPAPTTGSGPALKFWYKTSLFPTNLRARVDLQAATNGTIITLPAATIWTQKVVCLPPSLAGRPDGLLFSADGSGGGLSGCTTFPAEDLWIDDVELTTDASCPPT
jgi:hypothetical protein